MVNLTSTTRINKERLIGGIIMFRISVSAVHTSALFAGVLIVLVFTGIGRAAPNPTCTVQVVAGQSIQDAIEGAATGATVCVGPGTYQENLLINKDGITLKGAGPEKTVLEPPAQPRPFCPVLQIPPIGGENFGLNGICVADLDPQGKVLRTVNDIRVTGFTVRDFSGVGILFGGTNGGRADHNVAANNSSYGITAFLSTHGLFEYNTSYGSGDAGFYVGNSPNADFKIRYNTAFANLWGILLRDASTGSVTANLLHDSCSGLVFLNTGTTTGVHNWRASHNIVAHNDKFCSAEELPFSLTGVGILIGGGDHIVLRENRVLTNHPGGEPSLINDVPLAGGIVVVSTANVSLFPGFYGDVAEHNIVVNNVVLDNQPFDLVYDGLGSGNRFVLNRCDTSTPARLCRGGKSEH
jgi:nitrous oxidase accessory protein NosD